MNTAAETVLTLTGARIFDNIHRQTTPPIDLAVSSAQVIALVGPNAALVRKYLRVMAAVDTPEQGAVKVLGTSSLVEGQASYRQLRSRLGYMIGDNSLLPIYNGIMNVMLPALYHQRSRSFRAVSQDARALLDDLGCGFDIRMLPHAMSRYQQSLIELARALILTPEILYIEEPFRYLTTDDRRLFSEKLMAVRDRIHSKCIMIATDYLGFVRHYADQVLFVDSGCVEVFPGWEAFSGSRIPVVVQYLGREPIDYTESASAPPDS